MGNDASGILAYGYSLGGGESEWKIAEVGEYGEWRPAWLSITDEDLEPDMIEEMTARLLASIGFTESDWSVDGFFTRKREAEARLGLEVITHCSGDYPNYALVAHKIEAEWGDAKPIPIAELEDQRVRSDWDEKLRAALELLGITPKQERPEWLLLAYWG